MAVRPTLNAGTLLNGVDNAHLPTGTALTVNSSGTTTTLTVIIRHWPGRFLASEPSRPASAHQTLTINNTTGFTLKPELTGTGLSLVKSGSGAVNLGQAEIYGGSTTINARTLLNGVDNALPINTATDDRQQRNIRS